MGNLNNIIVFASTAFAAGIWQAEQYNWHIPTLIILAATLGAIALWRIRNNFQYSFWPIVGLFFIVGMIYFSQDSIIQPDDISNFVGKTVKIEGIVDAVPEIMESDGENKRVRYVIRVEKVKQERTKEFIKSSGRLRLSIQYKSDNCKVAAYGDNLVVHGKVLELHGYNNPGQIDMTTSLRREKITARMAVQEQDSTVIGLLKGVSWQETLANWREEIIKAFQRVMPLNDAGIITALLFGGYQNINKSVVNDFAATGLIHILSVSGAHIALVAGLIRWICERLRLSSLVTASLAALLITLYAVMSGLTPPVIRSAIMGLISLLAVVFERESYAPTALSITALGMLIYQPLLLFDISFQLSFGATAGLVFLYRPTVEYLSRLPDWLAGPLAVTLSAQIGVIPLIAWYFNNFSLISFAANILVLPIVELVILLGLAGVIIYMAIPVAGNIIFVVSSLLIGCIIIFTRFLAEVPYSLIYIPTMGLGASIVFYLLVAWVYGWRPFAVPGPKQLYVQWPKNCILIVVILAGMFVFYRGYPHPLTVHFIDVGQGDASLIITPHGRAVLIDTGGSFSGSNFDVGERVVVPYIKHYGVTTIDYLILTHGHQDHAGGAAGVASKVNVKHLMLPQEQYTPAVQALIRARSDMVIIPTSTGQTFELDGAVVYIEQAIATIEKEQAASSNEVSNVIRVTYGQHSFLITGDLEEKGEKLLLENDVKPCTVLKVGHHGAKTSTTAPCLQAVNPQFAVISVGYANRFGHPHPETLKRLEAGKTAIYRTDMHGAVIFKSNGKKLDVDTYIK